MAKLTSGDRKSLPKTAFALPGKGKGPAGKGSGSYPIPDAGHAKAALARSKEFASPSQQATIKRKVEAKFPAMDVKGAKKAAPKAKSAPKAEWSHNEIMKHGSDDWK